MPIWLHRHPSSRVSSFLGCFYGPFALQSDCTVGPAECSEKAYEELVLKYGLLHCSVTCVGGV